MHRPLGYKNGEMTSSVMLSVGQHFELFNKIQTFDNENAAITYFVMNASKIKIVNTKGITTSEHSGTFFSYNSKRQTVLYKDSKGFQKVPIREITSVFIKE